MRPLVPRFILDKFTNNQFQGQFQAVALTVDMNDFSLLTDRLMLDGVTGAEQLANLLGRLFDPMVDAIHAEGGFVVNFAGDAMLVLFPEQTELFKRVWRAVDSIRLAVRTCRFSQPLLHDFVLSMRIGLGYGPVEWGIVGREPRYSYYFRGAAISRATKAEKAIKSDAVIADPSFYRQCDTSGEYTKHRHAYQVLSYPVQNLAPLAAQDNPVARPAVEAFFPPAVLNFPESGEFRDNVVLFFGIDHLDNVQLFMEQILALQARYGGILSRLSFDQAGFHVFMFWGTPMASENDVEKALNFALELANHVPKGANYRAGITQGSHFAGFNGGRTRQEFTCLGMKTNKAARLMMKAPWGSIWCDETIFNEAHYHYDISALGSRRLKGWNQAIPVFQVMRQKVTAVPYKPTESLGWIWTRPSYRQFLAPFILDKLRPVKMYEDIRPVIRRQLTTWRDQLPTSCYNVLKTAAILGYEFDDRILAQMLEKTTILADHLTYGVKQNIWIVRNKSNFCFVQPLVRDMAYHSQVTQERKKLHLLAAHAYERLFAGHLVPYYQMVAFHYLNADLPEKAEIYIRKSSQTILSELIQENFCSTHSLLIKA